MSALDLLAQGIDHAVNGRECWIPNMDGQGVTWTVEHVGFVLGLTWDGLSSLDGEAITIVEHRGDPFAEGGLTALVLVADRVFPVVVNEWETGEDFTRAGAMTTVYPDEVSMDRYEALGR